MNETTLIRPRGAVVYEPSALANDGCGQLVPGGYLVNDQRLAELGDGDVKKGRAVLRIMLADEHRHKPIVGPTERPKSVRIAIEADEPALVALLVQEVKEHGGNVAPIDESRILEHVQMGTQKQGGIVGVIDGPDHKPIGTIGVMPVQWWFSRGWFLHEQWMFVRSDHRRSHHATDLIGFGKWAADAWSRAYGSRVYLISGALTTHGAKEKMRLYGRHTNLAGAAYIYPAVGSHA